MKFYIKASTIDNLRDEVDNLYNYASEICNERLVEAILTQNGANEDDSGEYGYLTGVSENQLKSMISELKSLINGVEGEETYQITLSDSEIELIVKALDSLTPPDNLTYEKIRYLRNRLF